MLVVVGEMDLDGMGFIVHGAVDTARQCFDDESGHLQMLHSLFLQMEVACLVIKGYSL